MIAKIEELADLQKAVIQEVHLPRFFNPGISLSVLRLDKIHATISGNKWFKLRPNLEEILRLNKDRLITFGGAYSNHVLASALACRALNIPSLGIIRGEKPALLSATLVEAMEYGMELKFIPRELYRDKLRLHQQLQSQFPNAYFLAEGGRNELAVAGTAAIPKLFQDHMLYSDLVSVFGTGTTMAGLLKDQHPFRIIGISSLKIQASNEIEEFIGQHANASNQFGFNYDYHFGGYAKYSAELIEFMNSWYEETGIPTDFVYTGKLFYAVNDLINKNYFPPGSRLMVIHSGGLQGNRSIQKQLIFNYP